MVTKGINKTTQKENNKPNGSILQNSNDTTAAENISAIRSCGFMRCRSSEFLPVRFFKHLGGKAAKGLHVAVVSMRIRPSHKVSSSSLGRPKPFETPVDSHRNAAIEDCIEFINSSASLPRSNSVSAS